MGWYWIRALQVFDFFVGHGGGKKKLAGMEQGGKYNIVESNAFSFSLSFWSGAFGMNFISRRSAMNVHEAMHVTRLLFLIEFQEVSHFALADRASKKDLT